MQNDTRKFRASWGYAPIPTAVIAPSKLHPLDSRKALKDYIKNRAGKHNGGHYYEQDYDTEEEAMGALEGFAPPNTSLWIKELLHTANTVMSKKELLYEHGLRA